MVISQANILSDKAFRFLRKLGFALLLFVLVSVMALFVLTYFFESKLKSAAITAINENLKAEITVAPDDIDLIWWSHFPSLTLRLRNLEIKEAFPFRGRLAKLGQAEVSLNTWDLFRGNYIINHLALSGGDINLMTDALGYNNFDLLKESDKKGSESAAFKLELKNVLIADTRFRYSKAGSGASSLDLAIQSIRLQGNLSDEKNTFSIKGGLKVNTVSTGNTVLISQRRLNINSSLIANGDYSDLRFGRSELVFPGAAFIVKGRLIQSTAGPRYAFQAKSSGSNIKTLVSMLPAPYNHQVEAYSSSGRMGFALQAYGVSDRVRIKSQFNIQNSTIGNTAWPGKLENVQLTGYFDNGENSNGSASVLNISDFKFNYKGQPTTGQLTLKNFQDPSIFAKAQGKVDAAILASFIPHVVQKASGMVGFNVACNGKFKELASGTRNTGARLDAELTLRNVNTKLAEGGLTITNLNGRLLTNANHLDVPNLECKIGESDFLLSGYATDLNKFLFTRGQKLVVDASLTSEQLRIEDLIYSADKSGNQGDGAGEVKFALPGQFELRLNADISNISFGKMEAKELKGRIHLTESALTAERLKLTTMGGTASVQIKIQNNSKNTFLTSGTASVNNLSIKRLFESMDNFGQSFLTAKNLEGTISSEIEFAAVWKDNLEVIPSTIRSKAKSKITGGQLNDFAPVVSMSKFIKKKNLAKLTFDQLDNTVIIQNELITIPETEIASSAGKIRLSGTHSFANNMDYRVQLNLTEILRGKRSDYETEFGTVAVEDKGGIEMFLVIKGTPQRITVGYDTEKGIKNFKAGLAKEGRSLTGLIAGKAEGKNQKSDGGEGREEPRNGKNAKPAEEWQKRGGREADLNWGDEEGGADAKSADSRNRESRKGQGWKNLFR